MNAQNAKLAEAALIHASACYASEYHGDAYFAAERRVIEIADQLIARAAIARATGEQP